MLLAAPILRIRANDGIVSPALPLNAATCAVAQIEAFGRGKMGNNICSKGSELVPLITLFFFIRFLLKFYFAKKNYVDTVYLLSSKYIPRWKRHGSIVKDLIHNFKKSVSVYMRFSLPLSLLSQICLCRPTFNSANCTPVKLP